MPVPETLAADMPPAYYYPPATDGSRPGTYFVNTHEPGTRARFEAESVAFHEAVPGHHFQVALAAEMGDLPKFRRHALVIPFAEGWGLYAERLADEMGLYSTDLDRLGMLSADSWRAGRLVVDTGIHALGWTRQRAVDFLTLGAPSPHRSSRWRWTATSASRDKRCPTRWDSWRSTGSGPMPSNGWGAASTSPGSTTPSSHRAR